MGKKRFISDDELHGETTALKFGLAVFLVFLLIKIFDATELFMTAAEPSFNEVVIIGSAVLIALYLGLRKGIKRFSNPA